MEHDIADEVAGHNERNAELKARLLEDKVDLDEQREIELQFWAPAQQYAVSLAKELYDRGYLVMVIAPCQTEEGDEVWDVEVRTTESPNRVMESSFITELVTLAATHECAYDGWGTEVE